MKITKLRCGKKCVATTAEGSVVTWGIMEYDSFYENVQSIDLGPVSSTNFSMFSSYQHAIFADITGNETSKNMNLYGFGINTSGQLGDGTLESRYQIIPAISNTYSNFKLVNVATGDNSILQIEVNNQYVLLGSGLNNRCQLNPFLPLPEYLNRDATQIQLQSPYSHTPFKIIIAGLHHTVFVDHSNNIFAFGANENGQCGQDRNQFPIICYNIQNPPNFTAIRIPSNSSISQVALGLYHTALLTERGEVFVWGIGVTLGNGLGQDAKDSHIPIQIFFNYTNNRPIKFIGAGYKYTAVATERDVIIWGVTPDYSTLFPVPFSIMNDSNTILASDEFITYMSSGEQHTILLTSKQRILAFGSQTTFQLGANVLPQNDYTVVESNLLNSVTKGKTIRKIVASKFNSYVLIEAPNTQNLLLLLLPITLLAVIYTLCPLIIIITICIVIRKCRAKRKHNTKQFDLEKKLLETEKGNTPMFNINKDLYEISFEKLSELEEIGNGGSGAVVYVKIFMFSFVPFQIQSQIPRRLHCFEAVSNIIAF